MKESCNYVAAILSNSVVINCITKDKQKYLKELKAYRKLFNRTKWYIECQTGDKVSLAKILERLRDLDFYFAGAPAGWPPAAVFSLLRDKKLLSGEFKEIYWTIYGRCIVVEHK